MEEKTSSTENHGASEPAIPPPPPPRKKKYNLQITLGIAGVVLLILVIFYYLRCVAPYEDTDDAFIDGYVTLISPRISGPVTKLLITDNQEVKAGDVLLQIDPSDYEADVA